MFYNKCSLSVRIALIIGRMNVFIITMSLSHSVSAILSRHCYLSDRRTELPLHSTRCIASRGNRVEKNKVMWSRFQNTMLFKRVSKSNIVQHAHTTSYLLAYLLNMWRFTTCRYSTRWSWWRHSSLTLYLPRWWLTRMDSKRLQSSWFFCFGAFYAL